MNLFDPQYPEQLSKMDVVFYRNVSIYFSADVQKNIFKKLSALLTDEGYLFLSSAETYFYNTGALFLHEMENAFVYQKRIDVPVEERRTHRSSQPVVGQTAGLNPFFFKARQQSAPTGNSEVSDLFKPRIKEAHDRRTPNELFDEAMAKATDKEYPGALLTLKILLEMDAGFKKALSLKASIHLNMQNLDEAAESVKKLLALDDWDLEGLLLQGMIAKTKEREEEAVGIFKKAIYISPKCWLAHFYLAELYYGMDDGRGATYEYGVVASIIEKNDDAEHGLTFFPLSFPPNQLARLCRHNIQKITQGVKKGAVV